MVCCLMYYILFQNPTYMSKPPGEWNECSCACVSVQQKAAERYFNQLYWTWLKLFSIREKKTSNYIFLCYTSNVILVLLLWDIYWNGFEDCAFKPGRKIGFLNINWKCFNFDNLSHITKWETQLSQV